MRSPRLLPLGAAAMLGVLAATPASALRIATYNILNYSSGRTTELQTVVAEVDPDVLVVEEILSQSAVTTFLTTVLDPLAPGEWAAGPFVNGTDTDNAIFYKPAAAEVLSHFVIGTALRDIDEWTVRPAGYASSETHIRIYAVHLKASQGGTNETLRLAEVTAMRTRMESFPAGQSYVVLGDFNIYTSSEPAYQYMLGTTAGLAGVVVDPIDEPGSWHNNAAFADIHTQSPRTTQFGGGANGGMDDRFDLILVSPALNDGEALDILPSTYEALGQDGQHFNGSLADPPYIVVTQQVAQAIHDASDHLPVLVDVQLPAILAADAALDFGTVITGALAERTLDVGNAAAVPGDDLDYTLAAPPGFSAPAGPFAVAAGAPDNAHTIGMSTAAAGVMADALTITSDAPDAPSAPVALSGLVLDHASPSLSESEVVLAGMIDFGAHAPGGFADQPLSVHNLGHGPLQALLEVHDAEIAGDPRFTIAGGFDPETVGATPAAWDVHFDDTGAGSGVYAATLTLRTRDQSDLPGAIDLADLVVTLTAEVTGAVDVADAGPVAVPTGIAAVSPNPFRPRTSIAFGLATTGHATLSIFDVAGRHVRTLTDGVASRGLHVATWDGRDAGGEDVGSGIFYVRLIAGSHRESRVLVRLR